MTQVANLANKQKKTILMLLTAIVAVAAAYGIYVGRKVEYHAAGSEALFHAREVFGKEMSAVLDSLKPKSVLEAEKAAEKADKKKTAKVTPTEEWNPAEAKFDVSSQLKAGLAAMDLVASKYDGTLAAFEARLLVGNAYYDHGGDAASLKKAYEYYKMAADKAPGTEQSIAGLYAAGYAQEAMGNCADAVKTFDQALNYGKSIHQADLLKAQARCYTTLGNKADAARVYDKLALLFPGSETSRYAQAKKADLK